MSSEWEEPPPPDSPVPRHAIPASFQPRPAPAEDLAAACTQLFLNPEYSDVKIIVGDHIFPAHKSIILPQCPRLLGCFQSDFRTDTITITEYPPKAIYRLLSFLYNGTYLDLPSSHPPFDPEESTGRSDPLFAYSTHVNFSMYTLGHAFSLPQLCRLAVTKQIAAIEDNSSTATVLTACNLAYATFSGRYDAMRRAHVRYLGEMLSLESWDELMTGFGGAVREAVEKRGEMAWEFLSVFWWIRGNGRAAAREFYFKDGKNGECQMRWKDLDAELEEMCD